MQIELDNDQLGCIEEFASQTGRSIDGCVYQAIDDWIKVVAKTVSQTEKFNVVAMLPELKVN